MLAACTPDTPPLKSDERNLFNVLKKYDFYGQDGEPVNIEALKTKLSSKGQFTTLTFSFNGCASTCPLTNFNLREIDRSKNENLTHVIVSVQPEFDGGFNANSPKGNEAARKAFKDNFRRMGITNDLVLLYPKQEKDIIPLQRNAGVIVKDDGDPREHSAAMILYAPDGTLLDKKVEVSENMLSEWKALISSPKGAAR